MNRTLVVEGASGTEWLECWSASMSDAEKSRLEDMLFNHAAQGPVLIP